MKRRYIGNPKAVIFGKPRLKRSRITGEEWAILIFVVLFGFVATMSFVLNIVEYTWTDRIVIAVVGGLSLRVIPTIYSLFFEDGLFWSKVIWLFSFCVLTYTIGWILY